VSKKKHRQIGKPKQIVPKEKSTWWSKLRPFMFPVLFGLGSLGAYFINVNDLMNNSQWNANSGVRLTWIIEVCTYLCIIGLIVLGYQFQSKLEKQK